MKVAVVLLTWKRVHLFKRMLRTLATQSYKDFDVIVSHSNPENVQTIKRQAYAWQKMVNKIVVREDSNEDFAFRRMYVGRDLAKQGYEVILFIDDDITIGSRYVEQCLEHYEPKTYKSSFAWQFDSEKVDYYFGRTRIRDTESKVHYCGTGVSMIDASIFLQRNLIKKAPKGAIKIEDLWLSYYAQQVMGWKLQYIPASQVSIGGGDSVALYRQVSREDYDKTDFLRDLVEMGWEL